MQALSFLPDSFAEYEDLKTILDAGSANFDIRTVCEARLHGRTFPVLTASIGSSDPLAPAIGFFGGIHGLERIGTQLVLDYMRSLLSRLEWDELLVRQLQSIRLIFMPICNPGGKAMPNEKGGRSPLFHGAPRASRTSRRTARC